MEIDQQAFEILPDNNENRLAGFCQRSVSKIYSEVLVFWIFLVSGVQLQGSWLKVDTLLEAK
jgi:hypothetical protein